MILIKPSLLRKLNLRTTHKHSGEHGDYYWEVTHWNENEEYCSKYDYEVAFTLKSNGRAMGTHLFYGMDANGKQLKATVNWVIHHFIGQRKRPPRIVNLSQR